MATRTNPFEELYVSETIPPEEFVELFSPFLVPHALPLFQPGNVILKGTQGSGKTMLLSLLEPAIRLAYAKAKKHPLPVPAELTRFISAGVNLRKSGGIALFGQRPIQPDPESDREQFPLFFGDFLNYWIVLDLLKTVMLYSSDEGGIVARELGLNTSRSQLDAFARRLAADECWFGALGETRSFENLTESLQVRLKSYFNYLNFNTDLFPDVIRETKTLIGQPISRAAALLREASILPPDLRVFIRIDQYEEITAVGPFRGPPGELARRMVNRMVGMRDPNVSYRIGVRRYGWEMDLTMYGTTARLEREREYSEVDLDELLTRRENSRTYIFPKFANDVLARRLRYAGYNVRRGETGLLREIVGSGLTAEEKASMYARNGCSPSRIVGPITGWPDVWRHYLLEMAEERPYEAKLAQAWARQSGGVRLRRPPPDPSPDNNRLPWTREYWRKERKEQALMQLAAGCAQRMIWAGADEIENLSGGNILVFVSICRHIWGAWLRTVRESGGETPGRDELPAIDDYDQTIGIEEASRYWYGKTTELPGGHRRRRVTDVLARNFQKLLLDDRAMSYPGRNGFSLTNQDIAGDQELRGFLEGAVDSGDLVRMPHTTKEKDRLQRTKFYIKPILAPHYRIPYKHVKEPLYVTAEQVRVWILEAERTDGPTGTDNEQGSQGELQLFVGI